MSAAKATATTPVVDSKDEKQTKGKRNTVAATVDNDLYERVQDYRWTHRLSISDVVAEALKQFLPSDN